MSYGDTLTLIVACLSYAVAASVRIELSSGRRVTAAAALGPAMAVLGTGGYELAPWWMVIAGALGAEALLLLVLRRPLGPVVGHAGMLSAAAITLAAVSALVGGNMAARTLALICAVVAGAIIFSAADLLLVIARRGIWSVGYAAEEARAAAPVDAVFASTAGLVVLTFASLGWAAFLVLLLPLLAVRHEFVRFATARRTYEQTVRALGRLTERAGYAPTGRHDRLASLCDEIAARQGVWGERAQKIRLVALMHDVGAVSLPDAEDRRVYDRGLVRTNTVGILLETGYLADLAPRLDVSGDAQHSVDARILREADLLERKGVVAGRPR